MEDSESKDRIVRALRRHLAGAGGEIDVAAITTLTGGASATTARIDLHDGRSLILRCTSGPAAFVLNVDKTTEAKVQSVAHRHGVRVAKVLAILDAADELGQGYVMERVPGDASPAAVLGVEAIRAKVTADSGTNLAAIHRVPLAELPPLPDVSVRGQLEGLREAYDSFGQPSAVFESAFRFLERDVPAERPRALVHGDYRTGNLLVDASGITAVLDWELCHVGSPIEDLGWLCVAAWRFGRVRDRAGGFASVEALRDAYVGAGGAAFDERELTFWEVYGTLRWGVVCLYQVFAHLRGTIPSIERAAIGRRVSEVELDLLRLVPGGRDAARSS